MFCTAVSKIAIMHWSTKTIINLQIESKFYKIPIISLQAGNMFYKILNNKEYFKNVFTVNFHLHLHNLQYLGLQSVKYLQKRLY
jgi:hypothetical protein